MLLGYRCIHFYYFFQPICISFKQALQTDILPYMLSGTLTPTLPYSNPNRHPTLHSIRYCGRPRTGCSYTPCSCWPGAKGAGLFIFTHHPSPITHHNYPPPTVQPAHGRLRPYTHTPITHITHIHPYTHTPIHPYTHRPIHPYTSLLMDACKPVGQKAWAEAVASRLHRLVDAVGVRIRTHNTYTHTPVHPYAHTPIHSYAHAPIHPYTHTLIHLYTHTPIPMHHTHSHTYAPMYTHTPISRGARGRRGRIGAS